MAIPAPCCDISAVLHCDFLCDSKAQAGTSGFLGAGRIQAEEFFENDLSFSSGMVTPVFSIIIEMESTLRSERITIEVSDHCRPLHFSEDC